jgi:hypothetical protein
VKVSDALLGIRRLYVETAPLIHYVEENLAYVAKMDTIVEAVDSASIEAVSSVITLTEVLVHPLKLGDTRLEQEYRDILLNSSGFRLQAVTARIAESAPCCVPTMTCARRMPCILRRPLRPAVKLF